jgi:hypothetical protein
MMRRHLPALGAVFLFASKVFPGTGDDAYRSTAIDSAGQLHIVLASGREVLPRKLRAQVSFGEALISEDGKTIGWLAYYPYPDTPDPKVDPIPQSLVLYRSCRVMHTFPTGQIFWSWAFFRGGQQVSYCTGPTHGGAGECDLRDTESGRLLAKWLPSAGADPPAWAAKLNY